jgi:pyruvate,water dikinase
MTTPAYILPLADPQATVETAGGKGASLARLTAAGFPVPDGFHITTAAYRRCVEGNGLQDQILAAAAVANPDQPKTLEAASRRINLLFTQSAMPNDITAGIRREYSRLGSDGNLPVAVRSSATSEDLPDASFAGQLDTFLNVRGASAVIDAVLRCWASLWTARAIGYRAQNGIAAGDAGIAVVVQKLVPADAAGILFTMNPSTGMRDQLIINAAWGLGEAIVDGKVTPDTIVVNKSSGKILEQSIRRKDVQTVRTATGTIEETVPVFRREKPVLTPGQARKLARIGTRIEALYGTPMDIEWALDRGRIFIIQARPITTLLGHNPAVGEWNETLTGDDLWTNANYGEAVPDVMTPCTWSIVQILLDNADPTIGEHRQYGNIGGRVYGNLSRTASIAAAFGIGPKRFAKMIADGFGRLPEGIEIPITRVSRLKLLRALPSAVIPRLLRARKNLQLLASFLHEMPGQCELLSARIQAIADSRELAELWKTEVAPFFIQACRMLDAVVNQSAGAILFLHQNLQKMAGETDADALLTSSGSGRVPLSSLEPLLGLTQLARGAIDGSEYARRFGHRGPHEMEVSTPRSAEDPLWIETQLAGLRQTKIDAPTLLARQEAERQAALTRLHKNFPGKEKSVRRQIESWVKIAHEREAVRSELIRAMWVLRVFCLRAGALTGEGEGIFFLSIDEILALLGGDRSSLTRITPRRKSFNRYCALPPYPGLIRGRFDPFQWAKDPQRRVDFFDAGGAPPAPAGGTVTGFPGASGIVEGLVRVIASADEGEALQPGEILVTTITNVGWTPLFPRAAAVVTDVGAPLSHAAIVARELGIPAVVGCGNATMRLHTGDRVRVNGGRGIVEVIAPAS